MLKILLALVFLCLGILVVGTAVAPQDSAFWLAANTADYQRVRIILMIIIFAELVTRPPRHMAIRVLAGMLAATVGVWVADATYNYQMPLLDTLCFASAAIAIAVAAIERRAVLSLPAVRTSTIPIKLIISVS